LSGDEAILYVALSNVDSVVAVSTADFKVLRYFSTTAPGQKYAGSYPTALALTSDGKRLFVADSSLDAVAVFDTSQMNAGQASSGAVVNPNDRQAPIGFIPTDWYPSALAVHGDDLLIATAKGEGTRPNKDWGKTKYETKHKDHPYIPTLLKGSI